MGQLPMSIDNNPEIAFDFAGSFQNAADTKKLLLVLLEYYNDRPEAKFLRISNTEKVLELSKV